MATVLITGANRGIGLELARVYAQRGDRVIAVCRKATPDLRALHVQTIEEVDVTSDADVDELVEGLGDEPIDILVNNAGVLREDALDALDFDGIRHQLEVNSLGPLRITGALLGNLHAGSKVAIVTSRMGSIGDTSTGGYYGYRMSKAAVNMVARTLSRDLMRRAVAVAVFHPGYVRTDMTGHRGTEDPAEVARQLVARIDALTLEDTGTFWHVNGQRLPW